MQTNPLIQLLVLIFLSGCGQRATELPRMDDEYVSGKTTVLPPMDGDYASRQRGLLLELNSDGTFEASVAGWSSSIGCMLYISAEAVGEWSVDVDEIAFHNVQATGELIDTFLRARIDNGGSALVLPSTLGIEGEHLQKGGQPNWLLPNW